MDKLSKEEFNYDLPLELIAQDPLEDRTSSRLLVLDKDNGNIGHKTFKDIKSYLRKGDCLVLNNTKVIPARLIGEKISDVNNNGRNQPAQIEILLLKRKDNNIWETLVKPGKKAKVGTKIDFGNGLLIGEVIKVLDDGNRQRHFT